jgi:hypothetical protein
MAEDTTTTGSSTGNSGDDAGKARAEAGVGDNTPEEGQQNTLDDRNPGTSDTNPTLSTPDRIEPKGQQSDAAPPTDKNLGIFLKKSGYTKADVLSTNGQKRTFVTSNGGKYQLTKQGEIRILKGPNYPSMNAEELPV